MVLYADQLSGLIGSVLFNVNIPSLSNPEQLNPEPLNARMVK